MTAATPQNAAGRIWMITFVDLAGLLLSFLILVFATVPTHPDRGWVDEAPAGPASVVASEPLPAPYLARLIRARLATAVAPPGIAVLAADEAIVIELPAPARSGLVPEDWPGLCRALATALPDPAAAMTLEASLPDMAPLAPALAEMRLLAAGMAQAGLARPAEITVRRGGQDSAASLRLLLRHGRPGQP